MTVADSRARVAPVVGKYVLLRNGLGPIGPILGPVDSGDANNVRAFVTLSDYRLCCDWDTSGRCLRYGPVSIEPWFNYDVVCVCEYDGVPVLGQR